MKTIIFVLLLSTTISWGQCNDREREARTEFQKRWNVAIPQQVVLEVSKSKRKMLIIVVYKEDAGILDSIDIGAMDFQPGTKTRQGDMKTPEGTYRVSQFNPASHYYLSMKIDYPHKNEILPGVNPGGDIYIHGQQFWNGKWYCVSAGCISLKQEDIKPLYWLCKLSKSVQVLIHS